MTYQSASQSGDAVMRFWNVRRWSRVGSLLLVLALWFSASIAMAAEVVEVRIGRHAQFTRVVFELDRAAGYRIERSESSPGVTELVVSLEASSIPRLIESKKTLIQKVDVQPNGSRAVAHIQLARDGLKLKEMILANPPRIVLDVLSDAPIVSQIAKAPAPAKPKSAVVDEPIAVVTPPVVTIEVKPEPQRIVEPEPILEVVAEAVAKPEAVGTPDEASPEAVAAFEGAKGAADSGAGVTDEAEVAFDDEPSTSIQTDVDQMLAEAAKPTPRPMVAKNTKKSDAGGGWMTWALAAVGVVVLLLGGLFVARRRSSGEVAHADDESFADDGASADNPFAAAGVDEDATVMGEADGAAETSPMDEQTMLVPNSQDSEEKESESVVFDDSEEETMDVISRDAVNESLGMPEMGAIPAEIQQMMLDMNTRMQALEGRCDELVDARDRLERQVAAQTEELRVQRAAIARTQRAVRNLGRPEDSEQEATEPALRDPNQPSSQE